MWCCAPAMHRSSRLRSARSRTCWSECGAHNHGENRGSSPLGSASNINELCFCDRPVSRLCPVEILGRDRRVHNSISLRLLSRRVFFVEGRGALPESKPRAWAAVGGLTVLPGARQELK